MASNTPRYAKKWPARALSEEEVQAQRKSRMGAIGAMSKQMGLDDDTLRGLFITTTGKASRRDMTLDELTRCRDALVKKGGKLTAPGSKSRALAVEAQAKKLRALWLRGAALGIVRDGSEPALASWASNNRDGAVTALLQVFGVAEFDAAIERLKSWLRREIKKGVLVCDGCGGGTIHAVRDCDVRPVIEDQSMPCDQHPDMPLRWQAGPM
jgi:phage gp16-like protein